MSHMPKKPTKQPRPLPPPGRKLTVKEAAALLYKKFPKTMEQLSK